jgi:hypothetical protein
MTLNVVTDSLTWERVFNGDMNPHWESREVAQAAAKNAGYSFMAFEGELWAEDRHRPGVWGLCAQSANMLAEGSAVAAALRQNIRRRDEKIGALERTIERKDEILAKTAKRASDAEERCGRQANTIRELRDAAATRVRVGDGRRVGA